MFPGLFFRMSAGPRTGPFPCRRSVPRSVLPAPLAALSRLFRKTHASAFRRLCIQTVHLCKQASHQADRQHTLAGRAPLHQRSKTRFRVSAGRAAQHQQVQAYVQRLRELYQRLQPGRAAAGFQLAYKHRGYTDLLRQLFLREPRVPACKPDARADLPIVHLAPSRCRVLILAYS